MKPTKVFLKQAILLLAIFIFLFPVLSHAQVKEIVAEGTYNMGDGETPSVAESRALLQAKRTALEQAGTYVESYTKVENLQLTKDEIQVLASGIMEVEILDKNRSVVGDGIHFWVKIKAKVNPDKIEELAKRVKEKSVVEDYKKIQESYDKSQKDIEELKKQLAQAKGEKEKKQVEVKITDEERLLQANEWFEKGHQFNLNNEYDKAIEAITSAIVLNPNFSLAYNRRGATYSMKGQYDNAMEDYNKAIILDPNLAKAYYNRGLVYLIKKQYNRAIEDFDKTIVLDPSFASAYLSRGIAYKNIGQYSKAIEDFNKAIAFNPNDAVNYTVQGIAYIYKRQYNLAIESFNKAIILDSKYVLAYYNRGNLYEQLEDMGKAISDFQKACDLGFQLGCKDLQEVLQKR